MEKSKKRNLIIFFIIICVFLLIFLIPTIFLSPLGKKLLISSLEKKTHGTVQIQKVSFSWLGPQVIEKLHLSSPLLELSIEKFSADISIFSLPKLRFLNYQHLLSLDSNITISDLGCSFHPPHMSPIIFANVNLHLKADKTPELHITGKTFEKIQEGSFTIHLMKKPPQNFDGEINCNHLPVIGLDKLLSLFSNQRPGALTALLGESLNFRGSFSFNNNQGPFSFYLDSSHAKALCNAYLDQSLLYLNKPFSASFYLTPDLTKWLSKKHPFFSSIMQSKTPINLWIDPKHFTIPLHQPTLKKFSIPNATVDLGILEFHQSRNIDSTLQSLPGLFHQNSISTIWFTPVDLSITDGQLKSDRMDFLINNSLHLCTWGKADLITKYVDMILGLPADALEKVLQIQNLPQNYVMQIPLRGTWPKIKLDKSMVATKLAALIAANQAHGAVGGILGVISTLNEKPAPPARRPFPWESGMPVPQAPQIFDFFSK